MTLQVKDGDAWHVVTAGNLYVKNGGSWVAVTNMYVRSNGIWYEFFPVATSPPPADAEIVLVAAPTSASGSRNGAGAVTSNSVTITPSVGLAPYTYAWTYISGTVLTVTSPTAAATTFSTTLTNGQSVSAVYRCTVTDAELRTKTIDVSVSLVSTLQVLTVTTDHGTSVGPGGSFGSYNNSDSVTASATGGNGSYTFAWTKVSSGGIPGPDDNYWNYSPGSGLGPSIFVYCKTSYLSWNIVLRCTATDSNGVTGYLDVTFHYP
jgi:hypothetical protein